MVVSMFSGTGAVAFDDLTFNTVAAVPETVPEPDTYAVLVGTGLALALLGRRLGFRSL